MKRICSECGCPVEDGDVFCPDCGHKLESQAQGQKQQQQQSQQQTKHEKKSVAARAKATDSESATESAEPYRTFSELFWDCEFYKIFKGKKFDLGQRVFEFGAFCWRPSMSRGKRQLAVYSSPRVALRVASSGLSPSAVI